MAKRIAAILQPASQLITGLTRHAGLLVILACNLSAFSLAHAADYQPRAYKAEYKLQRAGMTLGKTHFSLSQTSPTEWHYGSTISPKGLARMFVKGDIEIASTIQYIDGEITPIQYNYSREGKKAETIAVDFDWANLTAAVNHNGKPQSIPLTRQHQDPYSLVLSIMQAAARGETEISKQVVDKRVKQRAFKLEREEEIITARGKFHTLKYVQNDGSSRQIHYWLAPVLNYIPVKIERYKKGELQAKLYIEAFKWTP